MATKTQSAAAPAGEYIVDVERGHGMAMSNLKMRPTVTAVVKFSDGQIAWRGPCYFEGSESRNWKAQAGKQRRAYQSYFERTGNRWEVEQAQAKAARVAIRRAAIDARKEVREAAGQLLATLQGLVEMAGGLSEGPMRDKLFEARDLIAPLNFPDIPDA